jgi:hypothetical protein
VRLVERWSAGLWRTEETEIEGEGEVFVRFAAAVTGRDIVR